MQHIDFTGENETKKFLVTPKYKKSLHTTEYWTHTEYSNVTLEITTIFRYGEFEVTLTEDEYSTMETNEDVVILNNYYSEFVCSIDGCEQIVEITGIDSIQDETEKNKILNSVYENVEDEEIFSIDIIEENGWDIDETIYTIIGGVELKLIDE